MPPSPPTTCVPVNGAGNYSRFLLFWGGAFVVGAFLRLHALSSQILLDDEWHSLNEVIGKSWLEVLTRFNPQDNSSPLLNLYDWVLYHSFGWSEFTVHLPVMAGGLLSLILLPLWVGKFFGVRVSLIFTGFLAISPFLIFYSRYARTYGWVALLCYSALFLSHWWLSTGKLRYALGFVLAGALAIYAHLFATVTVGVPFVTAAAFKVIERLHPAASARPPIVVSLKSMMLAGSALVILLTPLLWSLLLQFVRLPWQGGSLTWNGILTAATLASGTTNIFLNLAVFSLGLGGLILLFKREPLLGWLFLATLAAYLAALLASRPAYLNEGATLLRYMIVMVPILLTTAALAIDCLVTWVQTFKPFPRLLPVLGVAGFLGCLYATGPLPSLQALPNNFMNHSAFQKNYRHHTWKSSRIEPHYPGFVVQSDQIPPFYRWLRGQSDIKTIIEYPFDTCDYNNVFYYYQHFHQKRVLAGYCINPALLGGTVMTPPDSKGTAFSIGRLSADEILSQVPDPAQLKFRNMVDVEDTTAVSRHADVIVLHKYIMALKIMPEGLDTIPVFYHAAEHFAAQFNITLGPPVYEDEQIICFLVKRLKPEAAK
jgi:hypothetical protein